MLRGLPADAPHIVCGGVREASLVPQTKFTNHALFLGGPTAAVIALQNPHIRVTVVDKDETRIRRWNSQHPPIYEPGLNEIVRIARDGSREFVFVNEHSKSDVSDNVSDASTSSSECGSQCGEHHGATNMPARQPNLFFTTDVTKSIAEADVVLIAVNTPTKYRGVGAGAATDMTAFEAVTSVVAQHARPGAIIVEKSTVPCRTAELVRSKVSFPWPVLLPPRSPISKQPLTLLFSSRSTGRE